MMLDIFITLVLVGLNGFFVAAEFAIVRVRASQLEITANSGNNAAKLSLNITQNLNAYLSATQLGITLASLGLGCIGESMVTNMILTLFDFLGVQIEPQMAHNIV